MVRSTLAVQFLCQCPFEELRDKFVAHRGQKTLEIRYDSGDRYTVDFGVFAKEMTRLIEENVIDPEFRYWIMPDFTTTKPQDQVIASVLMMDSMQKYFDFKCTIMCGIPSVTLLGEKADYKRLFNKIEKFSDFGDEPTQFAALLKPIVSRMIRTFDDPSNPGVIDFWQRILHVRNQMSGVTRYSGWVTAFCFWDIDGKCLYRLPPNVKDSENGVIGETTQNNVLRHEDLRLSLDGVRYHKIGSKPVPPGWSK